MQDGFAIFRVVASESRITLSRHPRLEPNLILVASQLIYFSPFRIRKICSVALHVDAGY
jgi:hypothetical protein